MGWAKAAWSNFFGPWSQGAAMFIQDARGKFNPKETLALLSQYPITTFCAPPTVYRLLVLEDLRNFKAKALRHCVGAGKESALVEHPAVAEAAVVASPDELRGEIVKAFVILAPGYTASEALAEELQEHVKKVTAPYKYPREIEFVTELPKTISGKIRRVELRARERARKAGK
jgi:acyl-coenzyme A synthetase/AMP-(fatty) acid ligase